jgi:hypothetical protein
MFVVVWCVLFFNAYYATQQAAISHIVIPAQAGIQVVHRREASKFAPSARVTHWIPACAGMTGLVCHDSQQRE